MGRKKNISSLIKELRKRLDLSQERLAMQLGVSFQTISRWERKKATPSLLGLKQVKDFVRNLGNKGSDLLEKYFNEEGI